MIVDVHTHLWDRTDRLGPHLGRCLNKRLARRPWDRPNVTPHALAIASQEADVVIIHGFVSKLLEADLPADLIAQYVAASPSRHIGFAGVDPLADDWRDRLKQATELKLSGITLSPAGQGFHPTHSRATQVFEFCVEHNLPVMIDAACYTVPQAHMSFGQPHLLDDVGREFPTLRLLLGQTSHPWTDEALTLIAKHEHFYADISSLASRPWQLYQVLQAAYQQDVIHKILLGSGFPFATPAQVIAALYNINGLVRGTLMPSIPRQELKSIVQRDALACLGIAVPESFNTQPARTTSTHTSPNDEDEQNTSPADEWLNKAASSDTPARPGQPSDAAGDAPPPSHDEKQASNSSPTRR